jgi:hypothetical protein
MPTYRAQDLANRITNVFYIAGDGLPRESYDSVAVYNYRRGSNTWASVRSATTGNVTNTVSIQNDLSGGNYTIARTGVQFSTDWGVVPVGMAIAFTLDSFSLPIGGILKIQAFKGTSTALTGDSSEFAIPLNEGLIPYSYEVEVDGINAGAVLYFNQTAINDFLANPDQNLFILGEYDYNNIAPTDRYAAGDSQGSNVGLNGQT